MNNDLPLNINVSKKNVRIRYTGTYTVPTLCLSLNKFELKRNFTLVLSKMK